MGHQMVVLLDLGGLEFEVVGKYTSNEDYQDFDAEEVWHQDFQYPEFLDKMRAPLEEMCIEKINEDIDEMKSGAWADHAFDDYQQNYKVKAFI